MAAADDETSTRAWLREALTLAIASLGSVALAKQRLTGWLAAGELPWSCMQWQGTNEEWGTDLYHGPLTHREGGPEFWGDPHIEVDWVDNTARGVSEGTGAQGIKVSRAHLAALLPAGTAPLELLLPADDDDGKTQSLKAWLPEARRAHRKTKGESTSAYARRLHALMPEPMRSAHKWGTVRRLLHK